MKACSYNRAALTSCWYFAMMARLAIDAGNSTFASTCARQSAHYAIAYQIPMEALQGEGDRTWRLVTTMITSDTGI